MHHLIISLFASALLISLDIVLRQDLITDNIAGYSIVSVTLFALIYSLRNLLNQIKSLFIRNTVSIILAVFFAILYWVQSIVYTVYFQFISAVDIGIVLGNLTYWSKGSDSLISIIKTPWLFAYLGIFLLAFLPSNKLRFIPDHFNKTQTRITILILFITLASGLVLIKKQHLYFLATPEISLANEFKKFKRDKAHYLKKIDNKATEGYYPRNQDDIPDFVRRGDFNVLLLVLESLRQDHMSLYGYKRDTTPFQRKRFKDAFHFPNAVSNATSTDTSSETIFTGMGWDNPQLHNTSLLWSYMKSANLNQFYVGSHWLQWNGWFGRSFLSNDVDSIQAPLAVDASLTGYDMTTARKFKKTLAKFAEKEEPFFGVLHFAGTHYPYVAPEEYTQWTPAHHAFDPKKLEQIVNQYDNSIRYNDAAIEVAITELEKLGLKDNTIIVVTADHGEAMYEHQQFFHGKVFWQEGIHVPIYIDLPKPLRKHFTSEELQNLEFNANNFVSSVDLFPTILDLYQIPLAKEADGFSLFRPYPETFIKVYMIPEEYAIINSHSGEKYHVDNEKRVLRYTNLRKDPKEKHYFEKRTEQPLMIHELIKQVSADGNSILK